MATVFARILLPHKKITILFLAKILKYVFRIRIPANIYKYVDCRYIIHSKCNIVRCTLYDAHYIYNIQLLLGFQ